MFIGMTDPQQTRLQRVVKSLVAARRGARHERSRGLAGLLDLDSARFDLAVSRAKPLVFPEGKAVGRPAPLSARLSRESAR